MTPDFHAVMIEGVFFTEHGVLKCRQDDGQVVLVLDVLRPLAGQAVHFSMHFVPPNPPQSGRWGWGSCLTESSGHCEFEHNRDWSSMLQVKGQGTLMLQVTDPVEWRVRCVDGSVVEHKQFLLLAGHHARLLMASALTVEQMRDTVLEAGLGDSVADLTKRACDLTGLLNTLTRESD